MTEHRAAPRGVTHLNPGDWMQTTVPSYARQHGHRTADPKDDWPVCNKAQVAAKHVRNGGSDLKEWGYSGPSTPLQVHYPGGSNAVSIHEAAAKLRPFSVPTYQDEDNLQVRRKRLRGRPS